MAFIDYVLDPPSYGWTDSEGKFSKPTSKQIFNEFFSRLNIFRSKKNWLPFVSWMSLLVLFPFFLFFLFKFFSWPLFVAAFLYGMIGMGTHGTIWYHRYSTHNAYVFKNSFWRFFTQNLVLKAIPEEIYVISHHVHHAKSDQPGDPYNANGGFLYCFLADVNHQPIAKNLSEADYEKLVALMKPTGNTCNTYKQYQKWGSLANPYVAVAGIIVNWSFWYGVFYLIGGNALGCALFAGAFFWAAGVRTFNFEGHGKGADKRADGTDFNRSDMSINQYWPGFVAGEWHNNHHLYPASARAGFLKHQIDFAWYYIYIMHKLGAVSSYHDSKKQFLKDYYRPYLEVAREEIAGEMQ